MSHPNPNCPTCRGTGVINSGPHPVGIPDEPCPCGTAEPATAQRDEARPIRPHRSGGGAPFLNEAEDRKYADWARAQDDDHLKHWATGTPLDRDALLKQVAAKREGQRRADCFTAGTEPATSVEGGEPETIDLMQYLVKSLAKQQREADEEWLAKLAEPVQGAREGSPADLQSKRAARILAALRSSPPTATSGPDTGRECDTCGHPQSWHIDGSGGCHGLYVCPADCTMYEAPEVAPPTATAGEFGELVFNLRRLQRDHDKGLHFDAARIASRSTPTGEER